MNKNKTGFVFTGIAIGSILVSAYITTLKHMDVSPTDLSAFSSLRIKKVSTKEISTVKKYIKEIEALSFASNKDNSGHYISLFKDKSLAKQQAEQKLTQYHVGMIYQTDEGSIVSIDNKLYRPNDRLVNGGILVAIKDDHVVIDHNNAKRKIAIHRANADIKSASFDEFSVADQPTEK
jgi:hypothetical protein